MGNGREKFDKKNSIQKSLYRKYCIDINDPKIRKYIDEFRSSYDNEFAKRLTRSWYYFLRETRVWLVNRLCSLFREEFGRQRCFYLDFDKLARSFPPICEFKFYDEWEIGNNSKKILSLTNKRHMNLQEDCRNLEEEIIEHWAQSTEGAISKEGNFSHEKFASVFKPSTANPSGKLIRFTIPGFEKKGSGYIKLPRKKIFKKKSVINNAVNHLVDNLSLWLLKRNNFVEWGAIEKILKYYEIDSILPKAKDFKKQLANRVQRIKKQSLN